jgi:lambda family phage tail tape measure protein
MAMLARLGVVLGLDSAEFQKGIEGADRQLDKLAKTAQTGAAVASAAFVAMTYSALSYADQITDTARANEVAVETILALSQGLVENGGSSEKAGVMLATFSKNVNASAEESKKAQDAFKKLGVSLKDLDTMSMEKLLDKTLKGLELETDALKRNALQREIFGRGMMNVAGGDLSAGMARARIEMVQYAQAVEQAGRMHDQIVGKAHQMLLMFTNAVIPTLATMYDHWGKNSAAQKFFFDQLENFVKYAAVGINTLVTAVSQLASTLLFMGDALGKALSGDFKGISAAYDTLKAKNNALWADNQRLMQDVMIPLARQGGGITSDTVPSRGVEAAKNPDADKALRLQQTLERARLLSAEYLRQNELALEQLGIYARIALYPQREQEVIKATLKIRQDLSNQMANMESKIQDALIMKEYELADVLRQQKKIIEEQGAAYITLTEQVMRSVQAQQYTFQFGWKKSFNQFNDDARNYSKLGANAFSTFTNTIESAIDQFAENGSLSFSKFALSVIADIAKMLVKFYAMQLAMMAVGFITGAMGGGGKGGSLKGDFMPSGMTGTGFAAEGGEIGGPTIVGEKGPELFIPAGRGNVIPNNRLSDALSPSTQPSIVYNGPYIAQMSAIDTQSALQFLTKNKMGVWAANQSANRSVPVNR